MIGRYEKALWEEIIGKFMTCFDVLVSMLNPIIILWKNKICENKFACLFVLSQVLKPHLFCVTNKQYKSIDILLLYTLL